MKKLIILFVLIPVFAYTQPYSLNNDFRYRIDNKLIYNEKPIHSSLLPYTVEKLKHYNINDSCLSPIPNDGLLGENFKNRNIWILIRQKSIVDLKRKDFTLTLNPILALELTKDNNGYIKGKLPLSINSRGLEVKGTIGKSISYYTAFYENQAFYPEYINNFINKQLVVPGQGISKIFEVNGHDFSRSEAQINFNKLYNNLFVNASLGHGKHFIGNGYRSMLLSDNAFNYPFVKLNSTYKTWSYTLLYAAFNSFEDVYYYRHHRKHGSFAYLSKLFGKKLELSLFEGTIWKTTDNETYSKKLPANYFNPIILSKIPFYGLNDEHNMVVGLNLRYDPLPSLRLYSQFMLDDCKLSDIATKGSLNNKYAYQAGIKYMGSNKHKLLRELFITTEFNYATPYSYGHSNHYQNYSHLNQALAHPLGGGFRELISIIDYTLFSINLNLKYQTAVFSHDNENSNNGTDIFRSQDENYIRPQTTGNIVGQGTQAQLQNLNIRLSYIIKPKTNFRIFVAVQDRNISSQQTSDAEKFLTFGIRTTINNYYFDF